jgi:hypothetical protein
VSVTTIPAAGNAAVAIAFAVSTDGDRSQLLHQALTSLEQLGLNLAGILVAGVLTLSLQRALWRRFGDRALPRR